MATYEIDSVAVNTRTDWRHSLLPGPPQGQRETQYPGVAERHITTGPSMPDDVIITGHIEGSSAVSADAAIAVLDAALQTHGARRSATSTSTVTYRGQSYTNCRLVDFQPMGPVVRVQNDSTYNVRQLVRFTWRRLK